MASDGIIYCIPYNESRVLAIDPFREFTETFEADMRQYPQEELGRLFEIGKGGLTTFESAILKFGGRGYQEIVSHLPPANEAIGPSEIYPFMVAASSPNGSLSAIYHLVRQAPEVMLPITRTSSPGKTPSTSKRRKTI